MPLNTLVKRRTFEGSEVVRVGGEQHQRAEARRTDRIALGDRLGRVADGVERVGRLADILGRPDISAMPPALSVTGPKASRARR